jgi:Tyrosine phosphatase family
VYRCASTDVLGETLDRRYEAWNQADNFVFETAGLILDLRSPSERSDALASHWIKEARGPIRIVEPDEKYQQSKSCRFVVRIDVLSPSRFMAYVEEKWLSPAEKAQASWFKLVSGQKLHELRINALNVRGLAGLNEAILETGKDELRRALQMITLHLEINPDDAVIIHCVQGKDR